MYEKEADELRELLYPLRCMEYIVIKTTFTTSYLQVLSFTNGDRGRYQWIAESDGASRGEYSNPDSEVHTSSIDNEDCFPRFYFIADNLVTEFMAWCKARKLKIISIKVG